MKGNEERGKVGRKEGRNRLLSRLGRKEGNEENEKKKYRTKNVGNERVKGGREGKRERIMA